MSDDNDDSTKTWPEAFAYASAWLAIVLIFASVSYCTIRCHEADISKQKVEKLLEK